MNTKSSGPTYRKSYLPLLAGILLATGATAARAQSYDGDIGMVGDGMAASDTGFAYGEPSKATPPYYVPPAPGSPEAEATQTTPGNWYQNWQAWKADLASKTGTTFDLYVNPSDQVYLGSSDSGINRAAIWYNFHLEQTLWHGARLVTNTRGGEGRGLDRYQDSLFNINKHTDDATGIYISHFYLEQKLFDDRLTLSAGKLDLLDTFDDNEVGSWNYIPYSLARNPSIPAPYHALGASARWDMTDAVYVQAGVADDGGTVTQTGFNTAFKSGEPYFGIYEIGIKPKFFGRPGTYRFILWDASTTDARFDGSGNKHGDLGAALSFDQQMTDQLGLFCRYGYADPSIHKINNYFSVGGTYTGLIQGRKDDVLGAGIAFAILSNDYRQANDVASTQTQVDLYYTAVIRPWISVTPDIQLLVNPDHNSGSNMAVVATLNVEMRF